MTALVKIINRHAQLAYATPLIMTAALLLMYYFGNSDLKHVVNFVTFASGK